MAAHFLPGVTPGYMVWSPAAVSLPPLHYFPGRTFPGHKAARVALIQYWLIVARPRAGQAIVAAGDDGLTAVGLGQPLEAEHYNSRWQAVAITIA